jgi:autotransporter-associated beta strand protein
MKSKLEYAAGLVTLTLILPVSADVIYSGLLDYTIPTTFAGLTVHVGDGTLNPFFGGVGVGNNPALQPLRDGTGGLDTILNLGTGSTINGSSLYLSTGDGGSLDHVGTTFTDGAEGYLGFKLDGTKYGWMRVVFTNNTSTPVVPVVKDWAYDNTTGAAITTGNITQSAPSAGAQTVTLTSGTGQSFTLGTQITNSLGNGGGVTNSVVKEGAGTAILTGTNNFSGSTTVSNGTLLVNGSITGSGTVSVASLATLGGTGSITGPVIVNGILSPGASIESLTTGALTLNNLSTFAYEMDSGVVGNDKGDLQIVNGDLTLNGHIDLALSESTFTPNTTTLSMIQYTGALLGSGGFFFGATALTEGTVFNDGHNHWRISYVAETGGLNFATSMPGSHFITLSNLTAIPEPGSLLALGCLIGSGALFRRRPVGRGGLAAP